MNTITQSGASDDAFVERVGRFFGADAAPRIAGRVLGLLLLSPQAMSLAAVAERLRVSKASVSNNARRLESWGAVERVSYPGDRRDFYCVAKDVGMRLLERRLNRIREVRALLDHGAQTAAAKEGQIRERFRALSDLQRRAADSLEWSMERLRTDRPERGIRSHHFDGREHAREAS